jgi:hypothetical protein
MGSSALRPPEPETPTPPQCDCGPSAWPRRAPRPRGPAAGRPRLARTGWRQTPQLRVIVSSTPSGALRPPISSTKICPAHFLPEAVMGPSHGCSRLKAFRLYSLSSSTIRLATKRRIQVRVNVPCRRKRGPLKFDPAGPEPTTCTQKRGKQLRLVHAELTAARFSKPAWHGPRARSRRPSRSGLGKIRR